jgi:hypothetical protein
VPPRTPLLLRSVRTAAALVLPVAVWLMLPALSGPAAPPKDPAKKPANQPSKAEVPPKKGDDKKDDAGKADDKKADASMPAIPPSMTRPDLGFDPPAFAKLAADPGTRRKFSFVLMGDQHFAGGKDSVKFFDLFLKKLPELQPLDFVITLGDQVNNGGNYRDWLEYGTHPATRKWFDVLAAKGIAVFPLAGNHEVGSRVVSPAEKALVTDDREVERLIAAASADPELRAARLAVYRGLRADLRTGVFSTNRPDWGKFFEAHFYADLFGRNADRVRHAPAPETADEMWYSFRHGNCLFVMLDGNHNTRKSWELAERRDSTGLRQFRFLEAELAAAEREGLSHVFVCVHQPLFVTDSVHEADTRDMRTVRYPAGSPLTGGEIAELEAKASAAAIKDKKDPKDLPPVRERELVHFAELLRRYRVSVTFSGHIHRYERFLWEQGNGRRLPMITTGGSGSSRGRSALNPDPEVLTVDHIERSLKGTHPRIDILRSAPGQRVHQMFPLTTQQQGEVAEKKLFVVRVTVDGPKVSLELVPLEELKRDGKPVPFYEKVDDLLAEPPPAPVPPTRTNFRRHVLADGGFPFQTAVGDLRKTGRTELLNVDLAEGITLAAWDSPARRTRVAAVDSPSALVLEDIDGNGLRDLFVGRFGRAGARGAWYWLKNPGPDGGEWKAHVIDDGPTARGAATAAFVDLAGGGERQLVVGCFHSGAISFYEIPKDPQRRTLWKRRDLSVPDGFPAKQPAESFGLRRIAAGPLGLIDPNVPPKPLPPASLIAAYSRSKEGLVFFAPERPKDEPADAPADLDTLSWKRTVIDNAPADTADMLTADLNGDGLRDIILLDRGGVSGAERGLRVYFQNRDDQNRIGWAKMTVDKTVSGGSAAAGDIDGDGRIDIVVTHRDDKARTHSVLLFRNRGGAFERRTVGQLGEEGPLPGDAGRLEIADLNGDGRPDVLAAGLVTGRIVWFETLPPDVPGDPE